MARATRRVAWNLPSVPDCCASICIGSELGPSTSFSITGTQLSDRYRVSSNWTRGSSIEMFAGRISGFLSPFLPLRVRIHRRLVGELGRNLDHRLVDQHRHGVQVAGVTLQPQPLRLQ